MFNSVSCNVCVHQKILDNYLFRKIGAPASLPKALDSPLCGFLSQASHSKKVTTILAVVNQFSKRCLTEPSSWSPHCIPGFRGLFSACLLSFVLPEDTVSDWGTQFPSQVWSVFMELLHINMSLRSSHQSDSNTVGSHLAVSPQLCGDHQGDWCIFITWAEVAQVCYYLFLPLSFGMWFQVPYKRLSPCKCHHQLSWFIYLQPMLWESSWTVIV